ncbi:hypothetical protein BFJ63_vAg18138 [Fusarium oxysporum f. sp. narcissi]|uniref:Nudix hydrolase domain-containing protein n=1 Tax=Fusarium oxysporum f. sp. narcissi TaxID=451672 RepID=A0A4Q2V3U9_FUSOX|nr:hypothetical protein BFJ63_vAg18138 [Fusarium oxysporum f. sp. narcissi]
MSTKCHHPHAGVCALIINHDGKILTGKRIGTIQVPGGHLEFGENPFACAKRETLEETGLEVRAIRHVATTNDVFEEANKHYITIFVLCEMVDKNAEPQTLEPEKCEGWNWKTWGDLMKINSSASGEQGEELLFLPLANLLKQDTSPESWR